MTYQVQDFAKAVGNAAARKALPSKPLQAVKENDTGDIYIQIFENPSQDDSWQNVTRSDGTLEWTQVGHGFAVGNHLYLDSSGVLHLATATARGEMYVKKVINADKILLEGVEGKIVPVLSFWDITNGGAETNSRYAWIGPTGVLQHDPVTANPELWGYFLKPGYWVLLNNSSVQVDSASNNEDPNAVHVNQAGEIAAIPLKASPVIADHVILEDSENGDAKRRALFPVGISPKAASQVNLNEAEYREPGVYISDAAANTYIKGPATLVADTTEFTMLVMASAAGITTQYLVLDDGKTYSRQSADESGAADSDWLPWLRLDNPPVAWQTLGTSGAIAYDCSVSQNAQVPTMTGDVTIADPTLCDDGVGGTLIVQGISGGATEVLSFGSGWDFLDGAAPVPPTDPTKAVKIDWIRRGTKFHASGSQEFSY